MADLREAAQAVLDEWDSFGPTGTESTLQSHARLRQALAAEPTESPHRHIPEYPSSCTGCEHLAADLASRLPAGLLPAAEPTESLDVNFELIEFAADRLVHVYGDSENADFIRALREMAAMHASKGSGRRMTPHRPVSERFWSKVEQRGPRE